MNSFGVILSRKFRGMIEMSASPVTKAVRKSLMKLGVAPSSRILVGVSGGVDSMVLLTVLHSLNYTCTAAHVNYQLRDIESDQDETLVRDWCQQNNIEFFSHTVDTKAYAQEHQLNIQSAAREIRYQWWESLMTNHQFDFLATAHHRDDNVETLFIHLLRGSGLKGLKGIPEKRDYIIRPLLDANRQDIESFAREFEIPFSTDHSNLKDDYLRNRLRHHLIPLVKEMSPSPDSLLKHTLLRLNVEWNAWESAYDRWKEESILPEHDGVRINIKINEQAYILKYLEEKGIPWSLAYDYVFAEQVTFNQPLHYEGLILSRIEDGFFLEKKLEFTPIQIIQPGNYELPGGKFSIEETDLTAFQVNGDPHVEYIDADRIQWPLQIRRVTEGDRFSPLGMQGKTKKLQDYLTDLKLSLHEKSGTLVLISGDQIIWVIGKRLDEKFKIRKGTSKTYKLTFLPG